MPIANINGADLYFETIGSGPPILMMHGLGLDHTYLRPWHDALADRARLIYYDHRLNGRSARGPGTADHATWHADALALLDHLGEPRATIFGHSYGAWLALGLALHHPERVAGLILCGSSPAFDYVPEVLATAAARNPEAAAKLVHGLSVPPPTDAAFSQVWQDVLPLYFMGPPRPELLANTIYSAQAFSLGMQCLEGFTTVDDLPSLRVPVLLLTGRHDFITPPAQAKRIAGLVPHARFVELTSSGHFPFVEEPDTYIAAIEDWLDRERRNT